MGVIGPDPRWIEIPFPADEPVQEPVEAPAEPVEVPEEVPV